MSPATTLLPFKALNLDKIMSIAILGDAVRTETDQYYIDRGSRFESVLDCLKPSTYIQQFLFKVVDSLSPAQKAELSLLLRIGRGSARKSQWKQQLPFAAAAIETISLVEKIEGDNYLRMGMAKLGFPLPETKEEFQALFPS